MVRNSSYSDLEFGDRLRGLRGQAGLSQEELAQLVFPRRPVGAARQRMGRIERGYSRPKLTEVVSLLRVLGDHLWLSQDEIRDFLLRRPMPDRKEVLAHLVNVQDALEKLGTQPNELSMERQELVEEVTRTVRVMRKIASLLPDRDLWETFVSSVQVKRVGSQLQEVYRLLQVESLLTKPEVVAMRNAVSFLETLEGVKSHSRLTQARDPLEIVCNWVNSLEKGDALFAVSYSQPRYSWLSRSQRWPEYHQANLDAARRQAEITRVFIYRSGEELDEIRPILREQEDAGITIVTVNADKLNVELLDFALFFGQIVCILSWDLDTRSPESIEFFSINDQSAQHRLIRAYQSLLIKNADRRPSPS